MALLSFGIIVSSNDVEKKLAKLGNKLTDHRELLEIIGLVYLNESKIRFIKKDAPNNMPWKKNTPYTIKLKKYGTGNRLPGIEGPYSIGVWTGKLRASLMVDVTGDHIAIGIPRSSAASKYAQTFQLGANRGAFGTDAKGRPNPLGNIPPRPFLGPTNAANRQVLNVIKTYLDYTK